MDLDAVFGELFPGSLPWSFVGAAWTFLLAFLLGALLWPRLPERETPARCLLIWWLIGTSLMGPIVLALSVFSLMTSRGLVATCATLTVLAGALAGRRLLACGRAATRELVGEAREASAATRLAMVTLVIVLALATLLACIPTTHFDDLVYHLGLPRQALILGSWPALPYFHHSFMPAGWEAAQALPLALGGGSGPQLMNVGVLALIAVATLRLARRATDVPASHSRAWTPWMATAFVLSFPVFLGLAAIAGNDLLVALGLLVALERLLTAGGSDADSDRNAPSARHVTLVAGLACGAAAAAKFTGLLGTAVLCAMALVWTPGGIRPRLLRAVGIGLLALVVAAPWFIRAGVLTGNPVYPQAHALFGGEPWDERSARLQTRDGSQGSLSTAGPRAFVNGLDALMRGADTLGDPTGAIPLIVPALWILAVAIVRRHRDVQRLLAYTAVAYIAWAATSLFLRFFLVPLLALAFFVTLALGLAQTWLERRGMTRPDLALALVAALAVAGVAARAADIRVLRLGLDTTWAEAFSRHDVLPLRVEAAIASPGLNAILPRDARLFVLGETRLALMSRRVDIATALDPPLLLSICEDCRTPRELTERLRGRATHLLVNYRELARFEKQYEGTERLGPERDALVRAWLASLGPAAGTWGAVALFDLAHERRVR